MSTPTKILTRQQILEADDLATRDVDCPEWGGTVTVRTMTGTQRDRWEADRVTKDGEVNRVNIRSQAVALSLVGEDGELLFTEADVDALGRKSAKALDRVFDVVMKLNGIGAADVEEMEKNSASSPGASSSSD